MKKVILAIVLIAMFTALTSVSKAVQAEDTILSIVPNCGVQSVLDISRLLGKTLDVDRTKALCATYAQSEISMFDVQQAAKQIGISLDGVKSTLPELKKRGRPFIAVLPNHFVCVERIEGDWVRYMEGTGSLIEPLTQFEAKYQGKALVLAPEEESSVLQISPTIVH